MARAVSRVALRDIRAVADIDETIRTRSIADPPIQEARAQAETRAATDMSR
jgi:hypothetical protein